MFGSQCLGVINLDMHAARDTMQVSVLVLRLFSAVTRTTHYRKV